MTRYLVKPRLPAAVRAVPHILRGFVVFMCFVWLTSCVGPEGMVRASEIKPAVDILSQRHDALLRGELDPSSLSDVQRDIALRTSEMLRDVVDSAAGEGR